MKKNGTIGVNVINTYKKPIIFFIYFLVILTLPLTIKAASSYIQTERITRDVGIALNEYFEGKSPGEIIIKDIWIKKLHSFLPGTTGFEYGFDYYSKNQWKKYECRNGEDNFTFTISDNFTCSSTNNLVFDDNEKRMIQIQQNDTYKDYSIKISVWNIFEKQLLLLYGLIVLIIDIIITLVWIFIRFIKIRKR